MRSRSSPRSRPKLQASLLPRSALQLYMAIWMGPHQPRSDFAVVGSAAGETQCQFIDKRVRVHNSWGQLHNVHRRRERLRDVGPPIFIGADAGRYQRCPARAVPRARVRAGGEQRPDHILEAALHGHQQVATTFFVQHIAAMARLNMRLTSAATSSADRPAASVASGSAPASSSASAISARPHRSR